MFIGGLGVHVPGHDGKIFQFNQNEECPNLDDEEILAIATNALQRANSNNQARDDYKLLCIVLSSKKISFPLLMKCRLQT